MLAARGAAGLELADDPALVLLGALVADVDTPGTVTEPGAPGWMTGRAPSPGPGGPGARQGSAPRPGRRWLARRPGVRPAWLRAAIAGGVVGQAWPASPA